MSIEEKPINKLTLKECRSAIRTLSKRILEYEDEMSCAESAIYYNEELIDKIRDRIKKLKPKN